MSDNKYKCACLTNPCDYHEPHGVGCATDRMCVFQYTDGTPLAEDAYTPTTPTDNVVVKCKDCIHSEIDGNKRVCPFWMGYDMASQGE